MVPADTLAQSSVVELGRFRAQVAATLDDVAQCLSLRARVFRKKANSDPVLDYDQDAYDDLCNHVLIHDRTEGRLVASCRFMILDNGTDLPRSYSAQFYDLERLSDYDRPILEIGRLCVHSAISDPDILRCVLAFLTDVVDRRGVGMMIGCSSFAGTDPLAYADAFAHLAHRHRAPAVLAPKVKARETIDYPALFRTKPDAQSASRAMPSLLRSYLNMGGWVSDHAVVDRDLNTLHVLTCVEVAKIPPARKRLLRAALG